jgi:hypothetical protein
MSAHEHHLSYLLRIWQDRYAVDNTWRASLQSINGGETRGFRSLDELYVFLKTRTEFGEMDDRGTTFVPE